ncbi:MAG: ECF transporter S component [Clostridia bacterium]
MKIRFIKENKILLSTTTAMLVAIGVLMPQILHAIPNAATLLSPMHIPVLLCGLICGGLMGAICGLLTPTMSFLIFGMPPFPNALVPMVFELVAYGLFSGIFMEIFTQIDKTKKINYLLALVCAMTLGRIVFVIARVILLSLITPDITFVAILVASLTSAFINTWLGILIQLILVPAILLALSKGHILEKYDCHFAPKEKQS